MADTTPLNYLILIGVIDVLPALYEAVWLPPAVLMEMQREKTPDKVRAWTSSLPPWCAVRSVGIEHGTNLTGLDAGEREAIQLALTFGVKTVLMDENEGRRAALRVGLQVTGTIAVLESAGQRGLLSFRDALGDLDKTNFRLSAAIRREFLDRHP